MEQTTDYKKDIIIAKRDPTDKDLYEAVTIWVSNEYSPRRVFMGENGRWVFIGKFYEEPVQKLKG
jgi:hypothetical protein